MDRTLDPRISGGGSFSLASVASIRAFLESVCDELPALRGFHRSTYCTNDVRACVYREIKAERVELARMVRILKQWRQDGLVGHLTNTRRERTTSPGPALLVVPGSR